MSKRRPPPVPLEVRADDGWMVAATLLILAVALARCVVIVYPDIYWDLDPRLDAAPDTIIGLGPAGAAWLSVAGAAAATLGLAAYVWARGEIDWLSTVLALLGCAACAWHTAERMDGGMLCAAWVSGVLMGLALLHLCRHARPRAWVVAALAAMVLPMAVAALLYVLVDHPNTVAMYVRDRANILAAHGWAEGSPQQQLYERRLMMPEFVGAFGLSNVNGSIIAAMTLAALGLAAAPLSGRRWWGAVIPLALAAVGAWTVVMTRSKGAFVAMVVCAGLLAAAKRPGARRLLAPAAMALVALAVAAVFVRGAVGPSKTRQGEISLMVRAQYWGAAWRMLEHESVGQKLLGIGPARFKDLYTQWKDPLNPEEITSSHNVEIDGLIMLGIGGAAWAVMTLLWLWRAAGAAAGGADEKDEPPGPFWRLNDRLVMSAFLLAAAIFGAEFAFESAGLLSPEQFLGWAGGAIGFVALVAVFASPGRFAAAGSAGLLAAAAALAIHGQIEMTFFNPGSAAVAYMVMGAAAARPGSPPAQPRRAAWRWLVPAVVAIAFLAMALGYAAPLTRQQQALASAAQSLRNQDAAGALHGLEEAARICPTDPDPYLWQVRILTQGAMSLVGGPREAAAKQLIDRATVALDAAGKAGLDDLSLLRMRAQLLERAAVILKDTARQDEAIQTWRRVLDREPAILADRLHLADLLWSAGSRAQARREYAGCLELNDASYLDPARQLPEEDLARIRARLADGSPDG